MRPLHLILFLLFNYYNLFIPPHWRGLFVSPLPLDGFIIECLIVQCFY